MGQRLIPHAQNLRSVYPEMCHIYWHVLLPLAEAYLIFIVYINQFNDQINWIEEPTVMKKTPLWSPEYGNMQLADYLVTHHCIGRHTAIAHTHSLTNTTGARQIVACLAWEAYATYATCTTPITAPCRRKQHATLEHRHCMYVMIMMVPHRQYCISSREYGMKTFHI